MCGFLAVGWFKSVLNIIKFYKLCIVKSSFSDLFPQFLIAVRTVALR